MALVVRALRWRAGASVAVLLAATAAMLAAAGGPIYARAADASVLLNQLDTASAAAREVDLVIPSGAYRHGPPPAAVLHKSAAPLFRGGRWLELPGVLTLDYGLTMPWPGGPHPIAADLVARTGVSHQLQLVAGRFPTRPDEVAISTRSAQLLGLRVGDKLRALLVSPSTGIELLVMGIYRPGNPAAPYWAGSNYFGFNTSLIDHQAELDSVFTPMSTVTQLVPSDLNFAKLEFPLRPEAVGLSDTSVLRRLLAQTQARAAYNNVSFSSGLPGVLAIAQDQQALMTNIVAVVDLQLVLLALFVLHGVVSRTGEARSSEVALARLRGQGPVAVVAAGVGEPLILICCAVPLGIVGAWLVVRLAAFRLLLPGVSVTVPLLALGPVALAFGGALAATAFASAGLLTRHLIDQLRAVTRQQPAAWAAAADAVVLALAVAGLVELGQVGVLRAGRTDPLAVFAPGLLSLALAVGGMRALPVACRLAFRPTRDSRFVGAFLAVRQVGRRPSALRQITVLGVATGLCTFAVAGWMVADANRGLEAAFDVGAAQVLKVHVPPGVDLLQAVRRADPSGRQAMAVIEYSSPSETLLAVDSSRLAAVAPWPAQLATLPPAALARFLNPHLPPPILVRGTQLQLDIDYQPPPIRNPAPATLQSPSAPDLQVTVVDPARQSWTLDFGNLVAGSHAYSAALPNTCATRCSLSSLTPMWEVPGWVNGTVDLELVLEGAREATGAGWEAVPQALAGGAWTGLGGTTIRSLGQGLRFLFPESYSAPSVPDAVAAALPTTLPAVITSDVLQNVTNRHAVAGEGLDGNSVTLNAAVTAAALPRIRSGYLVDLSTAQRAQTAPLAADNGSAVAIPEVWISASAGRPLLERLRRQGLRILSVSQASTIRAGLDRGGLALAYDFFLGAAAAAAALVVTAVVFGIFVDARRRAYELAVLRAFGVSRGSLLRGLFAEQLLVLGSGVALGVMAGLVSAALALHSVPELLQPTLPLSYALPVLAILAVVGALAILVVGSALVAALRVVISATPERLRLEAM